MPFSTDKVRQWYKKESKIEWAKRQFIRGAFDIPQLEKKIEEILLEKPEVEELIEFEVDQFPNRFIVDASLSNTYNQYFQVFDKPYIDLQKY